MGIIYCASFPNNKKYIGQTTRKLQERINEHIYNASHGSATIFSNAINKYGKEQIQWEILETNIGNNFLNEREIFWIKEKDTYYENGKGYNMTLGGNQYLNRCFIDADSELAYQIYNYYKECGSTVKTGKHFGYGANTINYLLTRIDNNWHQYSQIGRGHVSGFTEEEKQEVYEYYKLVGKITLVHDKFGIARTTIAKILKEVDEDYTQYRNTTKFTNLEVQSIKELFKETNNIKYIARIYNSSWETIAKVVH